jgi:hypothetical protein
MIRYVAPIVYHVLTHVTPVRPEGADKTLLLIISEHLSAKRGIHWWK